MRTWFGVRLMLVGLLVGAGLGVVAASRAGAEGETLDGCGDVFSVASIGIEGCVQGANASGSVLIVSVRIVNVTDNDVVVPVGDAFGVWEVETVDGDRIAYVPDRSLRLTRDGMGGDVTMSPGGGRTLKLVFENAGDGPLTLYNDDLGGDLARDGAPVCGEGDSAGAEEDADSEATDSATATATSRPAQTRRTTPTTVPTERPVTATATATEEPPTATATRRPATATPRPATATPGLAQPRRNTPAARRSTATPASRGSSAASIAVQLENSDWRTGEYFLDVPSTDRIDCPIYASAICVGAIADTGGVVFFVFDSASESRNFSSANELDQSIFTGDYLGYDYYWAPSYLSEDGTAAAVAVVGQVLVVAVSDDSFSGSSLLDDPDVNAIGLLMGGIERADRIAG